MAPVRSAAIHESALSPQEYDEYATLVDAFEASFASTARLPPPEVWQWLLQWLGQVDTRTEKEILSFFRLPGGSTSGSADHPLPVHTLLALTRLYSHSRDTRHLTRDLIFVATDPVSFTVAPNATPRLAGTQGTGSVVDTGPPPKPPQRSASLQSKPGNPFRRTGGSPTTQTGVGIGAAPAPAPAPPPTSTSPMPSAVHQRAASAPHPISPTSSASSRDPPPPPPPKRLGSAQPAATASRPTNPFLASQQAGESSTTRGSALPVSPPASTTSSSRSNPRLSPFHSTATPPTPAASSVASVAGSLPPLPPRPTATSGKQAPPPPSSSTKPPLAPRRSSKHVTLAGASDAPPPPPSRRASLPAPNSTRQPPAQPRLSIISSSSSSPQSTSASESQHHPPPPPSRLTSSTHIGINSSVRLLPSTLPSTAAHPFDDPSSGSGGQSGASSATGGSGTIRGRMSRSNSGVSAGAESAGAGRGVIGQKGYSYEPPRASPRKEKGRGLRSRSTSTSQQAPEPIPQQADDSASEASSSADETFSVRTDPLPSTSTFRSFSTASVHPPAPFSPDGTFQPTGTLARSRTVGSKPFRPPPPPKRRVEENPFETPGGGAIGLGRASSVSSAMPHHQRTTSMTSRASSSSATVTGAKEFGSEVASFLVQGARESARAAEGLVRRTSSVRKPSGKGERERLVDRSSSSDEESPLGAGEDGEALGEGEDEEELEVRMKELERGVRETVEKGQWKQLGES